MRTLRTFRYRLATDLKGAWQLAKYDNTDCVIVKFGYDWYFLTHGNIPPELKGGKFLTKHKRGRVTLWHWQPSDRENINLLDLVTTLPEIFIEVH